MRFTALILAIFLLGCDSNVKDQSRVVFDQIQSARQAYPHIEDLEELHDLVEQHPSYIEAIASTKELLESYRIRWWDAEAAKADSKAVGYLYMIRMSHEYFAKDTLKSVFTYMEGLGWMQAFGNSPMVDGTRRYAEVIGSAIIASNSPNMARLSFQVFERAKQLAFDYGDPQYIHLADSSYRAVARQVLTMPDSVRVAFGPPPERPARIPWVLATLAAAFIAIGIAGRKSNA